MPYNTIIVLIHLLYYFFLFSSFCCCQLNCYCMTTSLYAANIDAGYCAHCATYCKPKSNCAAWQHGEFAQFRLREHVYICIQKLTLSEKTHCAKYCMDKQREKQNNRRKYYDEKNDVMSQLPMSTMCFSQQQIHTRMLSLSLALFLYMIHIDRRRHDIINLMNILVLDVSSLQMNTRKREEKEARRTATAALVGGLTFSNKII